MKVKQFVSLILAVHMLFSLTMSVCAEGAPVAQKQTSNSTSFKISEAPSAIKEYLNSVNVEYCEDSTVEIICSKPDPSSIQPSTALKVETRNGSEVVTNLLLNYQADEDGGIVQSDMRILAETNSSAVKYDYIGGNTLRITAVYDEYNTNYRLIRPTALYYTLFYKDGGVVPDYLHVKFQAGGDKFKWNGSAYINTGVVDVYSISIWKSPPAYGTMYSQTASYSTQYAICPIPDDGGCTIIVTGAVNSTPYYQTFGF